MVTLNNDAWWKSEGEDAAKMLFEEIKTITFQDTARLQMLNRYIKLYTGRDNVTIQTQNLISRLKLIPDVSKVVEDSLRYNVVQSSINTLHSKICKRKEKVRMLTSGGSWQQQRLAQRADRMLYGAFMQARVHEINMMQTLDSYWSGSGFVQVGHRLRGGKVELCLNRIHPAEIIVDYEDSENGDPQTMRRIKSVPVELLLNKYPSKRSQIELLTVPTHFQASTYDRLSRRVLVCEAWHLPQDDGTGGRHILAIENAILDEEGYDEFTFPIIKQDYIWAPIGYYGIGVAELLAGHQTELDQLLTYRQACLKRGSNPRTYIEKSSLVSHAQLNNDINPIVEYSGTMPQQEVAPPYADQLFRDIEDIYQKAFREVGVSDLAATSQKPPGLNSGRALREFSDIESERFQTAGQNRQIAHQDIARAMIKEIKLINKLAKSNKEYRKAQRKVMSYDREFGLESFDLTEIEEMGDEFMIQNHNTSMFPQKPEGQLEFAQELAQAGVIGQNDALELLDFPDTSAVLTRQLASNQFPRKTIELMLDTEVFVSPDPYEDHARNFQIAQMYYNMGKLADYEEVKMDLLRRYMDANDRFVKLAQQAQQAQQMPPQAPMVPEAPAGVSPEQALLEQAAI